MESLLKTVGCFLLGVGLVAVGVSYGDVYPQIGTIDKLTVSPAGALSSFSWGWGVSSDLVLDPQGNPPYTSVFVSAYSPLTSSSALSLFSGLGSICSFPNIVFQASLSSAPNHLVLTPKSEMAGSLKPPCPYTSYSATLDFVTAGHYNITLTFK